MLTTTLGGGLQENILAESSAMLPDTRQRLEEAFRELQGTAVSYAASPAWLYVTVVAVLAVLSVQHAWHSITAAAAHPAGCPSPDCLLQEELGSSLSGSEELAQAEEQVAAVQQLFT